MDGSIFTQTYDTEGGIESIRKDDVFHCRCIELEVPLMLYWAIEQFRIRRDTSNVSDRAKSYLRNEEREIRKEMQDE